MFISINHRAPRRPPPISSSPAPSNPPPCMTIEPVHRSPLSDFEFKLRMIPINPRAPETPSQLSLFYATSLEIHQIARWCRASPENTLGGLPIVNDPRDLMLKDDGMALCIYDDTMKMWSTTRDWIPQWCEMGQRITDAMEKNPAIKSSWDSKINHLNMGYESLRNFREDMWVDDNGSVRPVPSPFMLGNSLDEEVKRLEAAFINLPCDEDDEEPQIPHSPLTDASDSATTPPLSPCSVFESPDSFATTFLPGSAIQSPFLSTFPLSLSVSRTISPYEIFSPLPQMGEDLANNDTMEEVLVPPAPVVPTQSLPEMPDEYPPTASLPSSSLPPSRSSSPLPGPSKSPLKRQRWSEDESSDDDNEFTLPTRKKTRAGKRFKAGTVKRASTKFEGKGTKCNLCGMRLGRVTDLPRHKASCKSNPERATRGTLCKICHKLLPVRADAIKRHLASKTCRSKRKKGDDEDPFLSES